MALKISGVEVVTDGRALSSIQGASGSYDNFHPKETVITTTIDLNNPLMSLTMPGNVTFSVTNLSACRSAILLLDTTSSGYTPTFPASVKWAAATTPTWGDSRYWQISFTVDASNTFVMTSAVGFEAGGGTETVSLSGTSGSPTDTTELPVSDSNYCRCGLLFTTGGAIRQASGTGGLSDSSFENWCNVTPTQTYYIRGTAVSTTTYNPDDSAPLNTWLALSSQRNFLVIDTRNSLNYADENFVIKIEIASDSGGSNILDTGYYKCYYEGLA